MSTTKGKTKSTTYTMTAAKKDWAAIADREAQNAKQVRAARADVVRRISEAGYSDTVIAQEFGISKAEVGKLHAAAIAKRAGFDVSATLLAIEEKGNGIEVGRIKAAGKNYGKAADLEEALAEMGLSEKRTTAKRKTTTATLASSTAKAVKDLNKIADRAKAGKIGLAVIAEEFEAIAADLKATLMG